MGIKLLQESYAFVMSRKCEFGIRFYERLFLDLPALRHAFPTNMKEQHQELLEAIRLILQYATTRTVAPADLEAALLEHISLDEQEKYLSTAREVLLATLRDMYGPAWSEGLEEAWSGAFTSAVKTFSSSPGESLEPVPMPAQNQETTASISP